MGFFYGYLGAMIALGILVGGYFDYMLQQYIYVILINVAFTFFNRQVSKVGHFGGLAGGFLATAMLIGCGVWHFLVDGDACPDLPAIRDLAWKYQVEMTVFVDYAHFIQDDYFRTILCEVGSDSVDLVLLKQVQANDLVITQTMV